MTLHLLPKLDGSQARGTEGVWFKPPALLPPEGSAPLGPPAGLPLNPSLEVNFHISNLGITCLLWACSPRTSSPPSLSRGFSLGDPELPTGSCHKTAQPRGIGGALKEEVCGLLPSPSPSLRALQVPLWLQPSQPQLQAPTGGRGEELVDRTQCPHSVSRSLPSPHVAMLGWETLAVRNPRLHELGITRELPIPSCIPLSSRIRGAHSFFPTVALGPEVRFPFRSLRDGGEEQGRLGSTGSERVGVGEFGDLGCNRLVLLAPQTCTSRASAAPSGAFRL